MSEALERVIAEQQAEIDALKKMTHDQQKNIQTVYTRHSELFETVGRYIDHRLPDDKASVEYQRYRDMRHESRMALMDIGWCFGCYSFSCECDHD